MDSVIILNIEKSQNCGGLRHVLWRDETGFQLFSKQIRR